MHHLHRWPPILVRHREHHPALAHDRVHVEDIPRHKPLQKKMTLPVAQLVQRSPQLLRLANLPNSQGRCLRPRLQQPRPRYARHVLAQLFVVQHPAKLRNQKPVLLSAHPHRQLVAIKDRGRQPHSRYPHVLPDLRRRLDVELVQRHDPVEAPSPCHPGNRVQNLLARQIRRHRDQVLQHIARPPRAAQLVHRQQRRTNPHLRRLAQEILPLLVARNAQKPLDSVGHRSSDCLLPRNPAARAFNPDLHTLVSRVRSSQNKRVVILSEVWRVFATNAVEGPAAAPRKLCGEHSTQGSRSIAPFGAGVRIVLP